MEVNLKESNVQSKTCKIEPKIPFYLIVAGILNIVLMVVRIIFQVSRKKSKTKWQWVVYDHYYLYICKSISSDAYFQRCCKKCADNNSDNAACATCGFLANLACINFYDMIALTLIIIWLGMYISFYNAML